MGGTTVQISNIPPTAIAQELFLFLEQKIGHGSVYALEIVTEKKNWRSKGFGRVQFETVDSVNKICCLCAAIKLEFQGAQLSISIVCEEIIHRPLIAENRVEGGVLHLGCLDSESSMLVLECWGLLKAELMPERGKINFLVLQGSDVFKLEIQFRDTVSAYGCSIDGGSSNAIVFEVKYGPRIYSRISGANIDAKFSRDRYHIFKEDTEFLWVRTTDFSASKSIGQSTCFCWELSNSTKGSQYQSCFPNYKELGVLTMRHGASFCSASDLVPVINCPFDSKLPYEILYQLNALVHTQKITGPSVNTHLFNILTGMTADMAMMVLLKLRKVKSTCYNPAHFIQRQLSDISKKGSRLPCKSKSKDHNLMSCHRVHITPSKVYFMGPELETSNHVVRHFSDYACDFLRVSFVEEDWSKLSPDTLSRKIEKRTFSDPYRTKIYNRIIAILRDGIVIGSKKFEFLAFSASQLRSNSVWMLASNGGVSAENIREWMGEFNKIRSISKCGARMGQLFSSSLQTLNVLRHDVQIIPDIEVNTDGFQYCFSDGIGKISLAFAKQVAQKCGLSKPPSAFQIRYGGYKGVIAVDPTCFRKLSLRKSMLKFDSENTMLCITKWSESMPCYLNREIVSLLSTLGIQDEKFESMQRDQIGLLDEMLMKREVALDVLEGMSGGDSRMVMVKMLLQGYEPIAEPYLLMMLKAHREHQLSDIRNKCRIFVPKGRVLFGCLDETDTLNYGEVFVRVTMSRTELKENDQIFFQKIDETTSVVLGKVVVTKNPCLHPGDIRVLQAIYTPELEDQGLIDCLVFPQKGKRPHPSECSGGDLDGDLYFVCWDENLIPLKTDPPMDYIAQRPRHMDHEVTLEEIQEFFVNYMISDTLGVISNTHLVYCDREPTKARSPKCLQLARLHSMAVDFAKTGAPAEIPRVLTPRAYPDFMERGDKPAYISTGVLGKLYRATLNWTQKQNPEFLWSEEVARDAYDADLEVDGFDKFLEIAASHKEEYRERLSMLMRYYGAEREDEILSGNLVKRSTSLQRDKKKYGEMKDRILVAVRSLHKEAEGWYKSSCKEHEYSKMASAWYHVTYHPRYCSTMINFLSFPWILNDVLLNIKSLRSRRK